MSADEQRMRNILDAVARWRTISPTAPSPVSITDVEWLITRYVAMFQHKDDIIGTLRKRMDASNAFRDALRSELEKWARIIPSKALVQQPDGCQLFEVFDGANIAGLLKR